MKRIFLAISGVFIVLIMVSYAKQGTPWTGIMVFLLSPTFGVPMGLFYPDPLMVKLVMILGLIVSLIMFIYGIKNHQKVIGQVLAVLGFLLWSFIGLLGLGTGT